MSLIDKLRHWHCDNPGEEYDDGSARHAVSADDPDANLVSSEIDDASGMHLVVLDIDFPCELRPSETPGHFHLIVPKDMPDRPRPPAVAYAIVAEHLTDKYFTKAPPRTGVRLEVTGIDSIPTYWEMSANSAEIIAHRLRNRQDIVVRCTNYDARTRRNL